MASLDDQLNSRRGERRTVLSIIQTLWVLCFPHTRL